MELGVVGPSELVNLLFVFLVVQVAATGRLFGPLAGDHGIAGVLELLQFNWLAAENVQGKIGGNVVSADGGYDDERALGRLIEGVQGCNIIAAVIRLFVPFAWQELQFALQVFQLRHFGAGAGVLGSYLPYHRPH